MKPVLKYKIVDGQYINVQRPPEGQSLPGAAPRSENPAPSGERVRIYQCDDAPAEKEDAEPGFFAKAKAALAAFFKSLVFHKKKALKSAGRIPRHIYMIWIGDSVPEYAEFAKAAYEKMNPGFEVSLLRYTVDEVLAGDDPVMQKAAQAVIDTKMGLPNRYYETVRRYLDEGRTFCQAVANIFRFILLEEKGGIYVDCDTLPLRPFDDELLKGPFTTKIKCWCNRRKMEGRDAFRLYDDGLYDAGYAGREDDYYYYEYEDIFLMGIPKGGGCVQYGKYAKISGDSSRNVFVRNDESTEEFSRLQRLFFACDDGVFKRLRSVKARSYIFHFKDRTWMKSQRGEVRSPRCLIDDLDGRARVRWLDRRLKRYVDCGFTRREPEGPMLLCSSAEGVPDDCKVKAGSGNCETAYANAQKINRAMLRIASGEV